MKTGKVPFVDASTLKGTAGAAAGVAGKAFDVQKIVQVIADSLREVFTKLPPLNILMVGASGEECTKQLRQLFGSRYFAPDHTHHEAADITRYQEEEHPLCIYQAQLHSASTLELSGCLKLMQVCEEKPETALDLLIFCVANPDGRLAQWEQDAIARLAVEVELPLLVLLPEGASAAAVKRAQDFLDDSLEGPHLAAAADSEGLCAGILELLAPEQPERGRVRAAAHRIKSKVWPDTTVQNTFVHLERMDYALKKEPIYALINKAAVGAGAKAAIPFGPDAPVLISLEAGVLASITAYFEVKVSGRLLKTLFPAVVSTSAATFAGKAIARNLQFIPNAITMIPASAVNAVTAGEIVRLIGKSYYVLLLSIEQNEISEEELGSEAATEKLIRILKTFQENARPQIKIPFRKKAVT